ncbi:MAG TPA: hypothetical protein VJY65_07065 [Chloroflexota bacterium]|nr:hypothetical protein [Chloroflexota bacterium]
MIKRLRIWWMYWRYRNITRRWQLLKPRLRLRHQPHVRAAPRARGTAMYMPTRSSNARGLLFVAVAAAVLAVVNVLVGPSFPHFWLDVLLFAGMAFAYMQYSHIL